MDGRIELVGRERTLEGLVESAIILILAAAIWLVSGFLPYSMRIGAEEAGKLLISGGTPYAIFAMLSSMRDLKAVGRIMAALAVVRLLMNPSPDPILLCLDCAIVACGVYMGFRDEIVWLASRLERESKAG